MESKLAALPFTSGLVPERLQRLTLKGDVELDAIESAPPMLARSQDVPAEPEPLVICQL